MFKHMKFKQALPILAVAISATAFAAGDKSAPISNEEAVNNPIIIAALSPSAGNTNNSISYGDSKASPLNTSRKTDSSDTCMGSSSTGVQLPIVGGLQFGSSWTDKNCMMIKNARELWNMGFKTAALARMCMDDRNREALESTGTPCPTRRPDSAGRQAESPTLTYLQ